MNCRIVRLRVIYDDKQRVGARAVNAVRCQHIVPGAHLGGSAAAHLHRGRELRFGGELPADEFRLVGAEHRLGRGSFSCIDATY